MPDSLRIGVIGAGSVARRIHAPGFRLCDNVEIAAVSDPNEAAAREFGAPQVFSDLRRLLTDGGVDAVVVSTPNYLHRRIALDAIAAGKHVLCEKPLAMTVAEAKEMLAAANDAGVIHMTAFTYGFTPAARYLQHLAAQGELGEIRSVRAAYLMALSTHLLGWRSQTKLAGSGVLGDIGSHLVHIVLKIAGDIARLTARQKRFRDDPASDVEDWISFLAEFRNGAVGTFEISRICPGRGADITEDMFIEIYGTKGGAVFSMQEPLTLQAAIGPAGVDPARRLERLDVPVEFAKLKGAPRNVADGDPRWSYRYDQAFHFVNSIRLGRVRSPSFADGVGCQGVLEAALRSTVSGEWVAV